MRKKISTFRYIFTTALMLWGFATTAIAQSRACEVLSQLTEIENGVFDLTNSDPRDLETILQNLKATLRNPDTKPLLFDQITHDPRWLNDFLRSHGQFLSLYIGGQYYQANNLKASASFRAFRPVLENLNAAFFCSPDDISEGNNSDGQIEEHKKSLAGESWLLRAMRQTKTMVARLIAKSSFALIPILIFLFLIAAVWGMIRIDEHRRACRRRFFCHVDVYVHYTIGKRPITRMGEIIDISRNGVGLMVPNGVPEAAIIQISTPDFKAELRVVRVNGNNIGAVFTRRLKKIPKGFALTAERKFIPRREYLKNQ